eukprot:m.171758 g.171758  ORF g.171758 m.171758 type:complete len:582 (+) comp39074_c0_seq6:92-1837(+)
MANAKDKWSKGGSFMKKPKSGWLHPDEILTDGGGVCYMVKYLGCIPVLRSMRTLQFEVRSQVTREAVLRILESAGLKPIEKKRKVTKNVSKSLGAQANTERSGTDINLTISIEGMELSLVDPPEIMAHHAMPSISFASCGEGPTQGMIAYVAKDPIYDRACHVFDCRATAQEVITTVGQAFELRYKSFLNQPPPAAMTIPKFGESTLDQDAWGSEDHRYNDPGGSRMGGRRALPATPHFRGQASDGIYADMPEGKKKQAMASYDNPSDYLGARSRMKNTDGGIYDNPENARKGAADDIYDNAERKAMPPMAFSDDVYDNAGRKAMPTASSDDVYDNADARKKPPTAHSIYKDPSPGHHHPPADPQYEDTDTSPLPESLYDNPNRGSRAPPLDSLYDNPKAVGAKGSNDTYDNKALLGRQTANLIYDNKDGAMGQPSFDDDAYSMQVKPGATAKASPFQMRKMADALPVPGSLEAEEWFHGQIARQQAESLLEEDGEFLVRESTSQAGQYVLTGLQGGKPRHMLLVDPEGVVRTKDRSFDSVQHLIKHHLENGLPIVSSDSTVTLGQPVLCPSLQDGDCFGH